MLRALCTGLFVLVLAVSAGPVFAQETVCNPKPYNMEACPNDIDNFLTRLNDCHQGKDRQCSMLPCQYADLLHKYKGDEMPLHLIQDTAKHITGSDYNQSCHLAQ